jgi:hypothetical protein
MSDKLNNSKVLYNTPMSEIMDELYREPSSPSSIVVTENSIQFFKEVEFKAPQTLSQDSGIKKSQLDTAISSVSTGGGGGPSNGLILSKSDW